MAHAPLSKRGRGVRGLAKTALTANVLVWGGAVLFLFALASEYTYTAFRGQWYNVLS